VKPSGVTTEAFDGRPQKMRKKNSAIGGKGLLPRPALLRRRKGATPIWRSTAKGGRVPLTTVLEKLNGRGRSPGVARARTTRWEGETSRVL